MKGVIFTEFPGFIEQSFGLPMADHLITATKPESGGAYTSVGTYDAHELVAMVVELGKETDTPVPDLIKAFGAHLFKHFVDAHAGTLGNVKTTEEWWTIEFTLKSVSCFLMRNCRRLVSHELIQRGRR